MMFSKSTTVSRGNLRRGATLSVVSAAIALLALPAGSAMAQVAPDSGQTLHQLQPQPVLPGKGETPRIVVPAESEGSDAGAAVRVQVNVVRIEGASQIDAAALQPLVVGLEGKSASFADLRGAARRITAYYRDHGFIVARAYLPQQEIKDGVVTISVLEGRLGKLSTSNQSLVRTDRVEAVVGGQGLGGEVLRTAATDRAMLLLSDMPGVGHVSGRLQPGEQVGTSDLLIDVPAGHRIDGEISADTFGNRYTGRNRLNARVDVNSPSGRGDRISLSGTTTDHDLLYGRAAYDAPIGAQGLRLGANLSRSRYSLGREFSALDATGTADTIGVQATYPLLRGLDKNVWLSLSAEQRHLRDDVHSTDSHTRRGASVATFDVSGDFSDALVAPAYSNWRVSMLDGHLSINSDAARAADAAGPRAEGDYKKMLATVSRLQSLGSSFGLSDTTAFISVSGQLANKNLDSSEKFVLGGRYGIRAYPQGEGVGDEGWLANMELRQRVTSWMQASMFYDLGQVRYAKDPYSALPNHRTMRGYGLGAGFDHGAFSLNLYAAWRGNGAAVTAPDSRSRIGAAGTWKF